VSVNMTLSLPASFVAQRVRFTVLKLKPYQSTTVGITCGIPYNLGAYINMAQQPGDFYRNFFYKKYHTILYDQTKIIRNTNVDEINRQISFNFNYRFPGTDVVAPHITNNPVGQTVFTNTPTKSQIWVLMSFEDDIGSHISRMTTCQYNVWRDQLGHGDVTETLNTGIQSMQELGLIPPPAEPEPEPEPEP